MSKRILIPTDGSEFGKTAIEYGIFLAKKLDARLTGLHVIDIRLMQFPALTDISGTIGLPLYQDFIPAIESSLEEKAQMVLGAFRNRCREAGLEVETKKAVGIIGEVIIEAGKDADWIVLAQRGEHFHFSEEGILGSTAETVVRTSGKPVMVTPAVFREIDSLLLAYDGSLPAGNALNIAAALAAQTSWPLSVTIVAADQKTGAELSRQAETLLGAHQVKGRIDVIKGKEDRELLRLAQGGTGELMVMGAYGHNRLRELLLGSTTSSLILKSAIPVLLTR